MMPSDRLRRPEHPRVGRDRRGNEPGAPTTVANALNTYVTGCGFGSTRWNARPSRSGSCMRWSIASTT